MSNAVRLRAAHTIWDGVRDGAARALRRVFDAAVKSRADGRPAAAAAAAAPAAAAEAAPRKKLNYSASFGRREAKHEDDELDRYLKLPEQPEKCDILQWWKERDTPEGFPILAALAREYLCVPATSIPCERLFSAMGNILSKKRLSLLPSRAEILCLLRENYDLLSSFDVATLGMPNKPAQQAAKAAQPKKAGKP